MHFLARLAGAQFRPKYAQETVKSLVPSDRVELEREPHNQYDKNAIQVVAHGEHIGYIQRDLAALIAPMMDTGKEPHAKVIERISPLIVLIEITDAPA